MTSSDADLIQQLLPHYHRQHFETRFHEWTKSRSKSQQETHSTRTSAAHHALLATY